MPATTHSDSSVYSAVGTRPTLCASPSQPLSLRNSVPFRRFGKGPCPQRPVGLGQPLPFVSLPRSLPRHGKVDEPVLMRAGLCITDSSDAKHKRHSARFTEKKRKQPCHSLQTVARCGDPPRRELLLERWCTQARRIHCTRTSRKKRQCYPRLAFGGPSPGRPTKLLGQMQRATGWRSILQHCGAPAGRCCIPSYIQGDMPALRQLFPVSLQAVGDAPAIPGLSSRDRRGAACSLRLDRYAHSLSKYRGLLAMIQRHVSFCFPDGNSLCGIASMSGNHM